MARHRLTRRSRRGLVYPISCALLVVALVFSGCGPDELSDTEEKLVRNIVLSGLEMEPDPYVRLETLQAIDIADDPVVARRAEALIRDPNPAVRVATVRTLLRSDHLDAPYNMVLRAYNNAESHDERYHLLDVGLADGDDTVRRALLERAERDASPRLRRRALEAGILADIDRAREAGDDSELTHELLPDLADYLDDDDPAIAARALRGLIDAGQPERADQFIEIFRDGDASTDDRIRAGRILAQARVEAAREAFETLLDDTGADDPDELGVPEQPIDDELLRVTLVGMAAIGDPEYVRPVQEHLRDADRDETIAILEALSHNPAEDAAITLRTDIRGARADIRRNAVTFYGRHPEARTDVLFSALYEDDFSTRQASLEVLTDHFEQPWRDYLTERLADGDPEVIEETLQMLQTLALGGERLGGLEPIHDRLRELAVTDELDVELDEDDFDDDADLDAIADEYRDTINHLAAAVLFSIADDIDNPTQIIRADAPVETRVAYIEHLATNNPADHADILRDHLRADYFTLRLLAAAGLWNAFSETAEWPAVADQSGDEE